MCACICRLSSCQSKHFSGYLIHTFICVCLSACDNRMSAKTRDLMRSFFGSKETIQQGEHSCGLFFLLLCVITSACAATCMAVRIRTGTHTRHTLRHKPWSHCRCGRQSNKKTPKTKQNKKNTDPHCIESIFILIFLLYYVSKQVSLLAFYEID